MSLNRHDGSKPLHRLESSRRRRSASACFISDDSTASARFADPARDRQIVEPVAHVLRGHQIDAAIAEGRGAYSLAACWRAVCEDAKLGSLRLHDLRHTAASQAVLSGEGLPLVGRLLGHNRHRTTAGYAHLADAHLVAAAEKVGRIVAEAMASAREN